MPLDGIGRFAVVALLAAAAAMPAGQGSGQDWPQFRGPGRDGVAPSFEAPKTWPDTLTPAWRVAVGEGHATPILAGDRLYAFARQGASEVMHALDAATGKTVWRSEYPASVSVAPGAEAHGPGPKATPAFANGRVYTHGMGGILTAFDAATGRRLWQKTGGPVMPLFGTAASPLVDRGMVIVHVGGHDAGALTAFDAESGAIRWSWNGDGPSYASPIVAEIDGVRQIITLSQDNVIGVSAADGRVLWRRPYSTEYTQNIITPVVVGSTVIVAGYQKPTSAFRIARAGSQWTTRDLWENPGVSLYMANSVLVGNQLFGFSQRSSGQYFVLDVGTGKTIWTGPPRQAENASIVRAGDLLLSLEDDAELVVGRLTGSGFAETKRYTVANSPTWAAPVVSGRRLIVKDASSVALFVID
jgi:outer membrane protein assembly factor BamB